MGKDKLSKKSIFFTREVLLSTGEFALEAVINFEGHEFYESAPKGLTLGLRETQNQTKSSENLIKTEYFLTLEQSEFDKIFSKNFSSQLSAAFSLSYMKFLSWKNGFQNFELFNYLAKEYHREISCPQIVCNILNGGKHAHNDLSFCEFMIIPKVNNVQENLKIVSEVYHDLKAIISDSLGEENLLIGREGGFSPMLSNVEEAITLLDKAINKRNKNMCSIAIDVAANNFSKKLDNEAYIYTVNKRKYTTKQLIKYYEYLLQKYPSINYLEDPFHENDVEGWKEIYKKMRDKILIVADDLTISKLTNLKKYKECFNACALKINQCGSFTNLESSHRFCADNGIKTIISQRSGETDSSVISHIAVGLGSDFLKAGAPARERIIKYNELLRITSKF